MPVDEGSIKATAAASFRPSRVSPYAVAALFAMWVVLSGKFEAFHLGVGAASVAFVVWLQRGLPSLRGADPRLSPLRFVVFVSWLFWQMLLSAIYVARVILFAPRAALDPQFFAFDSPQPSILNRVILANSITLTPGTITVDLDEDRFIIHALSPVTGDDVMTGDMAQRVANLSGVGPIDKPRRLPDPALPKENNVE